jgi:hypothetical protein
VKHQDNAMVSLKAMAFCFVQVMLVAWVVHRVKPVCMGLPK